MVGVIFNGQPWSSICTMEQQLYRTDNCLLRVQKCWSWCINQTKLVRNANQADGKWCVTAPKCVQSKDCQVKPTQCASNQQCKDNCWGRF